MAWRPTARDTWSSCANAGSGCNRSGRFSFALPGQPTDIVVDADGVRSFYAYDVNGLELEFTHVPG